MWTAWRWLRRTSCCCCAAASCAVAAVAAVTCVQEQGWLFPQPGMNSRAGPLSPARRGPAHLEVADGHSGLITRADDIEERRVLRKRPRRRVVLSRGMRSLIRILKR
uniref:Putative secreted protein n=1 Tax=Ixodes ricinus TaxID=34613 RepID=A0A6B0UH05_IXORI